MRAPSWLRLPSLSASPASLSSLARRPVGLLAVLLLAWGCADIPQLISGADSGDGDSDGAGGSDGDVGSDSDIGDIDADGGGAPPVNPDAICGNSVLEPG